MSRHQEQEQFWLLKYENPLAEKLSPEFFRGIPRVPGVYLMLGAGGNILYVGKAKDLRTRISSYRHVRPRQVAKRIIRLIHQIATIEWQPCASEREALLRENELLRKHCPPYNVLNKRPESYLFIGFRVHGNRLQLRLTNRPKAEKSELLFGTFKGRSSARLAYAGLLRLLWATLSRASAPTETSDGERFEFPIPLVRAIPPERYELVLASRITSDAVKRWKTLIKRFLGGSSLSLLVELIEALLTRQGIPAFFYRIIQDDFETLQHFFEYGPKRNRALRRAHGIKERIIRQDQIDDLLVSYQFRTEKNTG